MRCTKCGFDNPEGMKFCGQCTNPLVLICPKCRAENPAGFKFCGQCTAPLSAFEAKAAPSIPVDGAVSDSAIIEGERKTVTALFADIKGSMELIEDLDPEEARIIVDPALKLMIDAVRRYDGYIVQSTGDGIFALFGAPVAHEDHPQRALYAALRMQDEMRRFAERLRAEKGVNLQVRVGANVGDVVVRSIQTGEKQAEYTPIGHSISLASRLQTLANPGSIAISDGLRKLVEGYFTHKALGPARIKGSSEAVSVYEVTGLGPLRTRFQHAAARGLTKFVGRQREIEAMRHAATSAKDGRGQFVAVMAEPGVGKSRLFYEFKLRSQSGWMVLEALSVSHGKASPYLPVIELLHGYFGIEASDDGRKRREKVNGRIVTLDLALEDTRPYLFAMLGLVEGDDPLAQMDGQVKKRRTLDAIKRILLRESLNQPLMLIFEDLHWIDAETQAFLNLFVEGLANAPVLTLVNYRPEYTHSWGSKTYYTQLRLDPLGKESADEMLSTLLGSDASLVPLKRLIAEKTDGNPLFMEEIVLSLFEDGALARKGEVKLAKPLASLRIPPTVQGIIASRIDRLPADEKDLLQTVAVIGTEFSLGVTHAVSGKADDDLNQMLSKLQLAEFIYEQPAAGDVEYTFKHALTQEVAYNSVLLERRKELHDRAARDIEAIFHSRLDEHYGELAHHYSRSGNGQNAVKYLQLAGEQAIQRSAYAEAITRLNTAVELLKALPDAPERIQQELTLQIDLGAALTATKSWAAPEVESAYTRARQLCQQAGPTSQLFPVLWGLWAFYLVSGEVKASRELAEQLLMLAERLHSRPMLAVAHDALGGAMWGLGQFRLAREHLEQSLTIYDRGEHHSLAFLMGGEELEVVCRQRLAATLWCLGYPALSLKKMNEALTIAQELKSPFNIAFARAFGAIVHQFRREGYSTQQQAEAAMTVAADKGFSAFLGLGSVLRGWAMVEQRQLEEGIAQIQQGMTAIAATGEKAQLPYHLTLLADAYGQAGQNEKALAAVRERFDLASKTGLGYYDAELCRVRGELLLKRDGTSAAEAEAWFRRAIDIARKQSAKSWELRATISLARLLAQQSRRVEARAMLSEIYNWFTEGFDTADLKEAKALLDELAA
jgi:class 3 adenylate cyclase/predicted ATPase